MDNKTIEKNRPEGWDEISFNLGFATPYKANSAELVAFSAGVEAGADALIEAGYRLPSTANRKAIREAIQTCPPGKACEFDGVRTNENVCVDCITDQILSLFPKPSTANREVLEKLFENGVSCSDGSTHFLDESQKRYLIGEIQSLSPKPSTANREAVKDILEQRYGGEIYEDYNDEVAEEILSLISPPMEVSSDELYNLVGRAIEISRNSFTESELGERLDKLIADTISQSTIDKNRLKEGK